MSVNLAGSVEVVQSQTKADEGFVYITPFDQRVGDQCRFSRDQLEVMQLNLGNRCNLSCNHCHINAGQSGSDVMLRQTMDACLVVFARLGFKTLDLTGGAPEMNPDFEWLIGQAHELGIKTMVRTNLVILGEVGYTHLIDRFAEYGVVVIGSLPCYTQETMDSQRGPGSYDQAIEIVQELNSKGYGKGQGLELNLVYNPGGAFLPPEQGALEKEYKERLAQEHGIIFDNLFVITNTPLGRFGELLEDSNKLEGYLDCLAQAFNPDTLPYMMCRNQISVAWDGRVYDCDFNLAAGLACVEDKTIFDYVDMPVTSLRREIQFNDNCYACCAGAGSSCSGATTCNVE